MSIVTTPDEFLYRDLHRDQIDMDRASLQSFSVPKPRPPERKSIRKRNMTEKGRSFAIELKSERRNSAFKNLKSQINKILALRDSPDLEIETLERERDILDRLKEEFNVVHIEFDNLLETEEEREASYRWYDVRDREFIECRMKICEKLQSMERRSYQSSEWSSQSSRRRPPKSHVSQTSKISKTSSQSTKHISIALIDATTRAAKLEAELQCLENEKELRRLELERKLKIADAEQKAISRLLSENDVPNTKHVKTEDESKNEKIDPSALKDDDIKLDPEAPKFVPPYKDAVKPEQLSAANNDLSPNQQSDSIAFAINQMITLQAKQTELSSLMINQQRVSQLPIKEPPTFHGEPFEYPAFIAAFDSIITANVPSDRDRLYFLDKYTKGKANNVVKGFLAVNSSTAYKEARELLDKRFGNPVHVAEAYKARLRNWPEIKDQDGNGVQDYADFLVKCQEAMKTMQTMEDLDSTQVLLKASAKLPSYSGVKWCKFAHDIQSKAKKVRFADFVKFVKEEADLATDPIFSPEALKRERRKADTGKDRRSSQATSRNRNNPDSSQAFATSTASVQQSPPISSIQQPAAKQSRPRSCPVCNGQHSLDKCDKFIKTPVEERNEIVHSKRLCFGCLTPGHISSVCRSKPSCDECGKRHHTLLHGAKPVKSSTINQQTEANVQANSAKPSQEETRTANSNATGVTLSSSSGSTTNCKIVPVLLSHNGNPDKEIKVYALLDDASDTTFISEKVQAYLGITGTLTKLSLNTMLGRKEISVDRIEGLKVQRLDKRAQVDLPKTYARPHIPCRRDQIPTPETAEKWPHLQKIKSKIAEYNETLDVGLLIGCNCPQALKPKEVILGKSEDPYAVRTLLGWSIVGPVNTVTPQDDDEAIGVSHRIVAQEVAPAEDKKDGPSFVLDSQTKEVISPSAIKQMFEIDFSERKENAPEQGLSVEDRKFLSIAKEGVCQRDDGHYELPLPLKDECNLPFNRSVALRRLSYLKKRFDSTKSKQYKEDYIEFMRKVIDNGYAEKVPDNSNAKVWYIPHHGVYHPKKPNKIRVVFDCAAEHENDSLNKHLLQGPDLTNSLIGVLCRFRQEQVAFMCDIEAMFHQVKVVTEHRDLLRFLWWEDGDITQEPAEYRMTVHLFGATSSPGCANYALKATADDYEKAHGVAAANFLRNDFYVDDGLKSVSSTQEATQLIKDVKQMCQKGGFNLHKFTSNNKDVIKSIPEADRADGVKSINLDLDSLPIERALGIQWCVESDSFEFSIALPDKPCTRRGILSTVSSIFDPLGFVAPLLLEGKSILQDLCRNDMGWDDPIPDHAKTRWATWKEELRRLQSIAIPRCYKPKEFGQVVSVELHHFSDASVKGYGQCSYLRLVNDKQQIHCALVMGKSRVAPLKPVTIPRLELTAAVCSVRVSQQLRRELEYKVDKEVFWTDSKVVLGYINNQARRFHVFVANRVQDIQENTSAHQWRYVESQHNPADEASRGLKAQDLSESRWITGPEFLWKPEGEWPDSCKVDQQSSNELQEDDPEVKKSVTMATVSAEQQPRFATLEERLERFSDWFRAKRAVALCLTYIKRLRDRVQKKQSNDEKNLKVSSLVGAETIILQAIQAEAFKQEIAILAKMNLEEDVGSRSFALQRKTSMKSQSSLYKLDPFLDSSGTLRVGGRLRRASLSDNEKHPIILPPGHHVTKLIIKHFHNATKHQGKGMTLNEIRASGFWLIGGTTAVANVIHSCVKCQRLRGAPQDQKMADLPEDRLECAPPFSYAAVDYFGPFTIKEGRKELKRYGVLFTCMSSRAIHLEVARSLETDSFINALRRFISRRGPIRQLRSDQGTNFVGARRELAQALTELDQHKIKSELLEDHCDWFPFTMNVPAASHMGGVWERQIRSVRAVLAALLRDNGMQLDEESLVTLMCEAEAIVNSRPLTTDQLADPDAPSPLTPNHLLTMKSKIVLPPPGVFQPEDLYCRKRWRRVQHLANEFWCRWRKEFLLGLQQRRKWTRPRRNLQVNDVVIIKDDNAARNCWQLARVSSTYPSADGLVRKVQVALADSCLDKDGKRTAPLRYLERPVQKLVLLMRADDQVPG